MPEHPPKPADDGGAEQARRDNDEFEPHELEELEEAAEQAKPAKD